MNSFINKKHTKIILLVLLAVFLLSIFATVASADISSKISSSTSGVKNSLGKLFKFSAEKPGFLDFSIFFVIFLSLCWLGFSKWFASQQGSGSGAAVVGLSLGLSVAFAASLVYGAKFGVAKLLPFAILLIVLALFILLYVLADKLLAGSTGGTTPTNKKILAAVIALILTIVIVIVGMYFLSEKNLCEKTSFTKKLCGSESVIGKWFKDDGKTISGKNKTKTPPSKDPATTDSKIPKKTRDRVVALSKEVTKLRKELSDTRYSSTLTKAKKLKELARIKVELKKVKAELTKIIADVAKIK